jgi:hypothetical protein
MPSLNKLIPTSSVAPGPDGSSPYSQEPATGACPEPNEYVVPADPSSSETILNISHQVE